MKVSPVSLAVELLRAGRVGLVCAPLQLWVPIIRKKEKSYSSLG